MESSQLEKLLTTFFLDLRKITLRNLISTTKLIVDEKKLQLRTFLRLRKP